MSHRVEINEHIDIREFAPGSFAVFSTDKNEFLKIDGKEIAVDYTSPLILVLPEKYGLNEKGEADPAYDKLDLTFKDKDGHPLPTKDAPLLIVENHGRSVELAGNNLAVMGNVTMAVTQYELAGIDAQRLKDNNEIAVTADVFPADELRGNRLTYGTNQQVVALSNGRIDFTDAHDPGGKLLTLDGNIEKETVDIASDRLTVFQKSVVADIASAFKSTDENKKSQLTKIGLPKTEADILKDGIYTTPQSLDQHIHFWKWKENADGTKTRIPGVSPVQDEEEKKKAFTIPGPELEIPEGRKRVSAPEIGASETNTNEKVAQRAPSQEEFEKGMSHGLDPQVAYAVAKMNLNKIGPATDVDYDSKAPLGGPGTGGGLSVA
jgi:hypothetical protein